MHQLIPLHNRGFLRQSSGSEGETERIHRRQNSVEISVKNLKELFEIYHLHEEQWRAELQKIEADLRDLARNIGASVLIQSRIKSAASAWEKTNNRGASLFKLHDFFGIRIIVDSDNDMLRLIRSIRRFYYDKCYRFRDYITTPKPNGYQSFHLCLKGEGLPDCEIQIRTWDMHFMSEFGPASHDNYKMFSS